VWRCVVRSAFFVLLSFVALGLSCVATGETAAIEAMVLGEVLPELALSSDYIAFLYPEPLGSADALAPYAPATIPDSVERLPYLIPYPLDGETWLVWIDLNPYARYAHDTLFVLIDSTDGSYAIHQEQWWPVLNGDSLWVEEAAYWSEANWIASSLTHGIPKGSSDAICTPDQPGTDYYDWALVVNGWTPGQPNAQGMNADFSGICKVFNGLGMRTSVLDVGAASPAALENHVIRLFTEIPLYHCCDRLYFYITCHASPGALWVGGQRLSAPELARMLTLPGDTYVPSRVYVFLEAGYSGDFIAELSQHSNINRVWTASGFNEPSFDDLDAGVDPDSEDIGGEWTSSLLATLEQLLGEDPIAMKAYEYGREYIPVNLALSQASSRNAAVLTELSHPDHYLFSDADPDRLPWCVDYLARWDRQHHIVSGNLDEIVSMYEQSPCLEVLWFLNKMARHDALYTPSADFEGRTGKHAAKDLAHSNWWELCDEFWQIFTTPQDGE